MQSYARGPSIPLLDQTIGEALDASVARDASALALVSRHQGLRLSYGELRDRVRTAARGLWGMGIRPGDRVGMWAANSAEWVYLQAATALTGSVLENVNPAYRSHELGYVLRKSHMKALFLHASNGRANYLEILEEACRGEDLPLAHRIVLGTEDWDRMIAHGEDPHPPAPHIDDVVNIQYTSGTTGSPKGVLLTHRNIVNNAYVVGRALHVTPADCLCAPVPLYHCFGSSMSSLLSLVHGMPWCCPRRSSMRLLPSKRSRRNAVL
jgi:fatty-acyl-CoA synthase